MRSRKAGVSEATLQRISALLRCLRTLECEGIATTSSHALAERFGLNSAQIRKDLAHFGEFGVRGVGYEVADLRTRLRALMGLEERRTIVIVGAGNLGLALADSRNFNGDSHRVAALFDVDRTKIGGRSKGGVPILDVSTLAETATEVEADIAVLAIPTEAVAAIVTVLASCGVRAILNFAPVAVGPVPGTIVRNVDLTFFLEALSFQLAER